MSWQVTKSTVECYKFRTTKGTYWADITIDSAGEKGRISIASDFGSYQYYWGACGCNFKEFLAKLDIYYAAGKFEADRFFDAKKTVNSYKREVIEARREGWIDVDEARALYDECKEMDDYYHESEFVSAMWDQRELMKFFDGTPELVHDISPQFKNFWKIIWPELLRTFKEEKEAQP